VNLDFHFHAQQGASATKRSIAVNANRFTVKETRERLRAAGDETFAAKVTTWPGVEGFGDEVSVALLMVSNNTWFTTVDLLPRWRCRRRTPPSADTYRH